MNEAWPFVRGEAPSKVAPSWKLTVPEGEPAPGATGATTAEKVTPAPNTLGFTEEIEVTVVAALLTVCDNGDELLEVKFASPLYDAVMECGPTARDAVVSVAVPEASRDPEPRLIALSENVTVPVGAPPGEVTMAEKETDWPKTDGFAEDRSAVVVAGLSTVKRAAVELALPAELVNTA